MRIFNKMKKTMLVMMASLFCANVAFADTQTVYSWESPDGNPVEEGGVIAYTNGDASKNRLNYPNASYYTICLSGKKANINDETASNNAGHMLLTLNDALQEGDVISVTAYRNKGTGVESSIYFLFENGQVWEDTKSFADILDGEGVMPSVNTWEVTAAEAGCKTIKLTRNTAGTNLFITKLVITREVEAEPETPATQETLLTLDIFKKWDGVGADAQPTDEAVYPEMHVGEELGAGGMVYGLSTVNYLSYADLTAYGKIVFEGTPGVQLRVLMNRVENEGALTEVNPTIGEDGKAEVSFAGMEYVHLNAIKTGWESPAGTITKIALTYDYAAYEEAIAAAEAFKATLAADTYFEKEMIEELIVAIDEAVVFAKENVAAATSQVDINGETAMLNETVGMYKGNYDAQVIGFKMEEVRMAGQEALAKYPEETRVDNAGLVEALMNLPMRTMGYTVEQLQAAIDAVVAAIPAFEKENNQLILDAAKKKAADYAATLDASEETGTMVQIEAYNGLTYYTSDEFFTESGISADSYDMVMSYSQQIDMMIAQYDPVIQKEKSMMAATKAAAAAQETMASVENASDNAGLADAIAKVNTILGELNMWDTEYTLEDLNVAVAALAQAQVAFEKENNIIKDGDYYLKNVASGKFLVGGNGWGTFATLGDHAEDVALTKLADGKFSIDSRLSNGGNNHYLGGAGWMDGAATGWTFAPQGVGIFALTVDGVNYIGWDGANSAAAINLTAPTDANAQWTLVTKDELVAELSAAAALNPMDATFFIQDPNFGRNNTRFSAWQGAPTKNGRVEVPIVNFCAEKWNCNFDVYQDLTGLPNGYYKLTAQGFYRAGWGGSTDETRNAYLYAGAVSTPLMSILAEAGKEGQSTDTNGNSDVSNYGMVPNNMNTASDVFTNGLYADNSIIVEVTDGTLRIGVKKDVLVDGDWTIFDNFELTYYGTEIPPVIEPGTYYMKNVAAGKYLAAGNSWSTQASLLDCGLDMQVTYIASEAKYTFDSNVSNGGASHFLGNNGYMDAPAANWTIVELANGNYAITLDGTNYIGYDGSSSVLSTTLTDVENANAQWQFVSVDELKNLVLSAMVSATLENPADATFFISGQNFNRNDGRNAAWQGGPQLGGTNENYCAEKWNANFDIYQDLAGLPNGYYKVFVQGYYRAGDGGATDMAQNAYLYAGAKKSPLMNINIEAGNAVFEGGNVSTVEGMGIVPNNMATAVTGFAAGLYANNCVVVEVTDGTLRIGVKKDVLIDKDWSIFDNFRLSYIGTGASSVMFADAVDSLNAAIADANAWKATLDATNEMDAQVIAQFERDMLPVVQATVAQATSIAQIEQMIADVNMFVAQTSMTLGQMKAAEAQAFLAQYDDPAYYTEEFTAAFNEVFNIANGLATGAYTWADLDAALTKMNEAKETFVIQNVPAPAVNVIGAINGHRLVELTSDHVVETKIFYSYDEAMTEPAIYTAPIMVSETATVYAYAMFIDEATRERYISQKVAVEVAAGDEIVLNEPVIKETEEGLVITSDQSDVAGEPEVSIEYAFYPMTDIQTGELASTASESGAYTEALAGLGYGQLIAKAVAFGYTTSVAIYNIEPAKVAYLNKAGDVNDAIYEALVAAGYVVDSLAYADSTLTAEMIEANLADYDVVVLGGSTGSGDKLAKTYTQLLGKVNVLSTKAFWYAAPGDGGSKGTNPGSDATPSLSIAKAAGYEEHPIYAGIEGNEFAVFNDMGKSGGRYLQGNGSFGGNTPEQKTLGTTLGANSIGEAWVDNFGWIIIPVDGLQPSGYLTAEGAKLFVNAVEFLVEGKQYAGSGPVTDNPFGIDVTTTEEIQWPADIYDIKGRMVKKEATSLEGLQSGLYLIKGQKVLVK